MSELTEDGGGPMARRKRDALSGFTSFAEVLRDAMGTQSQYEVARAIGVSQGRVSRWVNGHSQPEQKRTVVKVARWLDVDPDQLRLHLDRWDAKVNPLLPANTAEALRAYVAAHDELVDRELRALVKELEKRMEARMVADLKGLRKDLEARVESLQGLVDQLKP